jgi:hypothetical protein
MAGEGGWNLVTGIIIFLVIAVIVGVVIIGIYVSPWIAIGIAAAIAVIGSIAAVWYKMHSDKSQMHSVTLPMTNDHGTFDNASKASTQLTRLENYTDRQVKAFLMANGAEKTKPKIRKTKQVTESKVSKVSETSMASRTSRIGKSERTPKSERVRKASKLSKASKISQLSGLSINDYVEPPKQSTIPAEELEKFTKITIPVDQNVLLEPVAASFTPSPMAKLAAAAAATKVNKLKTINEEQEEHEEQERSTSHMSSAADIEPTKLPTKLPVELPVEPEIKSEIEPAIEQFYPPTNVEPSAKPAIEHFYQPPVEAKKHFSDSDSDDYDDSINKRRYSFLEDENIQPLNGDDLEFATVVAYDCFTRLRRIYTTMEYTSDGQEYPSKKDLITLADLQTIPDLCIDGANDEKELHHGAEIYPNVQITHSVLNHIYCTVSHYCMSYDISQFGFQGDCLNLFIYGVNSEECSKDFTFSQKSPPVPYDSFHVEKYKLCLNNIIEDIKDDIKEDIKRVTDEKNKKQVTSKKSRADIRRVMGPAMLQDSHTFETLLEILVPKCAKHLGPIYDDDDFEVMREVVVYNMANVIRSIFNMKNIKHVKETSRGFTYQGGDETFYSFEHVLEYVTREYADDYSISDGSSVSKSYDEIKAAQIIEEREKSVIKEEVSKIYEKMHEVVENPYELNNNSYITSQLLNSDIDAITKLWYRLSDEIKRLFNNYNTIDILPIEAHNPHRDRNIKKIVQDTVAENIDEVSLNSGWNKGGYTIQYRKPTYRKILEYMGIRYVLDNAYPYYKQAKYGTSLYKTYKHDSNHCILTYNKLASIIEDLTTIKTSRLYSPSRQRMINHHDEIAKNINAILLERPATSNDVEDICKKYLLTYINMPNDEKLILLYAAMRYTLCAIVTCYKDNTYSDEYLPTRELIEFNPPMDSLERIHDAINKVVGHIF